MQLAQVGGAARARRGAQRQEVHVGPVGDLGVVGGEPQPPGRGVLLQQRLEADLEDVRLPSVQRLDPIDIDVDPDHVMAELRHAGGMGRTQIVGADDAHPQCHPQIVAQITDSTAAARCGHSDPLRGAHGREYSTRSASVAVAERFRGRLDAHLPVAGALGHCRDAVLLGGAADQRVDAASPDPSAYAVTSRTASVITPRPRASGCAQ